MELQRSVAHRTSLLSNIQEMRNRVRRPNVSFDNEVSIIRASYEENGTNRQNAEIGRKSISGRRGVMEVARKSIFMSNETQNQPKISKFKGRVTGIDMRKSTSDVRSEKDHSKEHNSHRSNLRSTKETNFYPNEEANQTFEQDMSEHVAIKELSTKKESSVKFRDAVSNLKIGTLPQNTISKSFFTDFMKVVFREGDDSEEDSMASINKKTRKDLIEKKRERIKRYRMSKRYVKSVAAVQASAERRNPFRDKFHFATEESINKTVRFTSEKQNMSPDLVNPSQDSLKDDSRYLTVQNQLKNVSFEGSFDPDRSVSKQDKAPAGEDKSTKPRQPMPWENRRRFCLTDSMMQPSIKFLKRPLELLSKSFKESIFDCESEIYKFMEGQDPQKIQLFKHLSFMNGGKFNRANYLRNIQANIEYFESFLRAGVSQREGNKSSFLSPVELLRGDPVLSCIRQFFNCESVLIMLSLYFKVLFHSLDMPKAESIAVIALNLSYIHDKFLYKFEAFSMLGKVFERKRDTERALFCFTRAMQLCWEEGDLVRDGLTCDRIGRLL